MNAACSVAKTYEDIVALAHTRVGAIVIGSVTLDERDGGPEPRWFSADNFALNAFSLPNGGREYYQAHLPDMTKIIHAAGKKAILSIAGFNADEYAQLAALAEESGADIIEVNLGCPHAFVDGKQKPVDSFNRPYMGEVISRISKVTDLPITAKLSPYSNPHELAQVAETMKDLSVAAVVTSNVFANAYMLDNGNVVLANEFGGMSGRALQPIAMGQVRQFSNLLDIPIIGVGGIESIHDVSLFRQAGASAVQAATLIVRDGYGAIDRLIEA